MGISGRRASVAGVLLASLFSSNAVAAGDLESVEFADGRIVLTALDENLKPLLLHYWTEDTFPESGTNGVFFDAPYGGYGAYRGLSNAFYHTIPRDQRVGFNDPKFISEYAVFRFLTDYAISVEITIADISKHTFSDGVVRDDRAQTLKGTVICAGGGAKDIEWKLNEHLIGGGSEAELYIPRSICANAGIGSVVIKPTNKVSYVVEAAYAEFRKDKQQRGDGDQVQPVEPVGKPGAGGAGHVQDGKPGAGGAGHAHEGELQSSLDWMYPTGNLYELGKEFAAAAAAKARRLDVVANMAGILQPGQSVVVAGGNVYTTAPAPAKAQEAPALELLAA